MGKGLRRAEKAARNAQKDLIRADELRSSGGPDAKRDARRLRKAAKRKNSKANRKLGRQLSDDFNIDELECDLELFEKGDTGEFDYFCSLDHEHTS